MKQESLHNLAPLHSIDIVPQNMKQIGVDITSLPITCDGFRYLVVAIDYFSKWVEAKALKEKTGVEVARFLFEDIVCRHGCVSVQINDQGREFCNVVSEELHRLTGTEQRVTSAYHPQANGLVERHNRTIKECLIKVLKNKKDWVSCISSALFAYRIAKQKSTGFTPFQLLYGRAAVLPLDVKSQPNVTDASVENDESKVFEEYFRSMLSIQNTVVEKANANILKSQATQKKHYDSYRCKTIAFTKGDLVKIRDVRRENRKGGKFCYKWVGPFTVDERRNKNLYTVSRIENGKLVKRKCNAKHMYRWKVCDKNDILNQKDLQTVPTTKKNEKSIGGDQANNDRRDLTSVDTLDHTNLLSINIQDTELNTDNTELLHKTDHEKSTVGTNKDDAEQVTARRRKNLNPMKKIKTIDVITNSSDSNINTKAEPNQNNINVEEGNEKIETTQHVLKQKTKRARRKKLPSIDECEIVSFVPGATQLIFAPVCLQWKYMICDELNLIKQHDEGDATHNQLQPKTRSIYDKPLYTVPVRGDGNCYFRSISLILCGSEDQHSTIRALVVQHMQAQACDFEAYCDSPVAQYLQRSKMHVNKTWATEVEIFVTSSLLKKPIYVYAPYQFNTNAWLKYEHNTIGLTTEDEHRIECIYLRNVGHHFEPVIDI